MKNTSVSLNVPIKGVRSTHRQARLCIYTGVPLWVSHMKKPPYWSVFKRPIIQYQKA
jgi:hypothetical protein